MTTQPKTLRDEILHVLSRASAPMNTGEIYERCQLTDEIKRVVDAVYILRTEGRIEAVDAPGRKQYKLVKAITKAVDSIPSLPEVPVVDRAPPAAPHIPTFLRKDAVVADSAPAAALDQFSDAGDMTQAVSYSINDSGNLCISDDDTVMLLPADEVKRLRKFLDRVAGLL